MSSVVCASSMHKSLANIYVKLCTSRFCIKMSSFLFVHTWAMPHILYLLCGFPFPVLTTDNISGLISVVMWLSRWEVINKISGNYFKGRGGKIIWRGRPFFEVIFIFDIQYWTLYWRQTKWTRRTRQTRQTRQTRSFRLFTDPDSK